MKTSDLSLKAIFEKTWEMFRCFIPMMILVSLQLGSSVVCSLVSTFIFSLEHPHATDAILEHSQSLSNKSEYIMLIMLVYDVVGLLAFGFHYLMMLKNRPSCSVKNISLAGAGKLVIFFIGLEVLVGAMLNIVYLLSPAKMESYFNKIESLGITEMTVVSTLVAIVFTPILEEIVYRAVTLNLAEKFAGEFLLANITQAAIFGLGHLNLVQGIYAFVMGLILGFAYKKYNSLAAPIIGHIAFNIAGTFLVPYIFGDVPNLNVARLVFIIAISLAVSVIGGVLVMRDIPQNVKQ